MTMTQYIAVELIEASPLSRGTPAETNRRSPWSADDDPQSSEDIQRRNGDIAEKLLQALPGLHSAKDSHWDITDYADEELSQEQVLRRYQRALVVAGPWRGGELVVQVFDEAGMVSIPVVDFDERRRADLAHDLEALLATLANATGMALRDPGSGNALSAPKAVEMLLARRRAQLSRFSRAVRRQRLYRRLGWPSLAVFTLFAAACALGLAWHGVKRGTLMAAVDPAATVTFLVESVPQPGVTLGLFPTFALQGRIAETGRRVLLPVTRDEYLRAGPAAPYTVLATGDASTPYVPRAAADATGPVLRVGAVGIAWMAWLAPIPLLLWYIAVARPFLRAAPEARGEVLAATTAKLRLTLQVAAVGLIAAWLKRP